MAKKTRMTPEERRARAEQVKKRQEADRLWRERWEREVERRLSEPTQRKVQTVTVSKKEPAERKVQTVTVLKKEPTQRKVQTVTVLKRRP